MACSVQSIGHADRVIDVVLGQLAAVALVRGSLEARWSHDLGGLFAWSAVVQLGHVLVAVVALGRSAWALPALVAGCALGAVVLGLAWAAARREHTEPRAYHGLAHHRSKRALVFLLVVSSSAGLPPLAGFIARLAVAAAAVEAGCSWLACLVGLCTVVALPGYLRALERMFMERRGGSGTPRGGPSQRTILAVVAMLVTLGWVGHGLLREIAPKTLEFVPFEPSWPTRGPRPGQTVGHLRIIGAPTVGDHEGWSPEQHVQWGRAMLSRSYSAGLLGVDGYVVTVEADARVGLPGLTVVGRTTGALSEARERVRSALAHCGHDVRPRKQVVNLAPADRRKDSPGMDLAIACALLGAHEVVPIERLDKTMLWGELSLDGGLRPAAGTLVVADCARRNGFDTLVVPKAAASEAALVDGLHIVPAASLAELVAHLRGEQELPAYEAPPASSLMSDEDIDMADIRGLALGRMAVEVMVAGGHNLLMHGPPGVGKTMLARRTSALFPALDDEAALEVTKIHGVALGSIPSGLRRRVPVRMPHHTVSVAGLLGGGRPLRPGEVSLSHRGVLFLDELPEFSRACLEGLREPLEDGVVSIVRAHGAVALPARFQLLAAMNPCPCGFLGHPQRACTCSPTAVARYLGRVSGPLVDRIDVVVPIAPAPLGSELVREPGEPSAIVRGRVLQARARQAARLVGTPWRTNAEVPARGGAVDRLCALSPKASRMLERLALTRQLSPRAQHRLRRVARTLADLCPDDLDPHAPVDELYVAEAAHLRRLPQATDG